MVSTLASQVGLSLVATLLATSIVAGLRYEVGRLATPTQQPTLTSGGKFAARVEAMTAAAEVPVIAMPSPASVLPRLAAHLDAASAATAALPPGATLDLAKTDGAAAPRHMARTDIKHRTSPEVMAHAVVPPRRADFVPVIASAAPSPAIAAEAGPFDAWTTTKTIAKQAVWLGGSVLDRLNPVQYIP